MTAKEYKIQYALGLISWNIKLKLAKNFKTSKVILTILSKDKNSSVRFWTANNPNTPIKMLKMLAIDTSWDVRYHTAINSNTPKEILKILFTDKNRSIRRIVQRKNNVSRLNER